jgi:hypothetical protein
MMTSYHIGLDFGTYQTKACVFDLKNNTHEFFYFASSKSYFHLSRVGKKSDGTFEYGSLKSGSSKKNYFYFKIAAAEDSEFIRETLYDKNDSSIKLSTADEFKEYSPELLSTLYITFIIFTIKEAYQKKAPKQYVPGALLKNSLGNTAKNKTELKFTIQMGIPTEWSQIKNLKRKKKFEKILMTSQFLQQKHKKLSFFLKTPIKTLVSDFNDLKKSIISISEEEHEKQLNSLGISVYPETAAGLAFITKTKQLLPGYYTIMDIGGGSTDISFFNLNAERNIRYLASESYLVASNNVYACYKNGTNSIKEIHKSQEKINNLIETNTWNKNEKVKVALEEVKKALEKLCYKLFNKRVYWYHKGKMVEKFNEQPIILYGGGARLPLISKGNILIHDNGTRDGLNTPCAYIQKQEIDTYQNLLKILPENNSWKRDFGLLVVALGLSLVKDSNSAVWLDDRDYKSVDGHINLAAQNKLEPDDKIACKCGGRNEDCIMCDGKGFIEKKVIQSEFKANEKKNEKGQEAKPNKSPSLTEVVSTSYRDEIRKLNGQHKKIYQLILDTQAILENKRQVRKLAFELTELEKSVKNSNLFLDYFNEHDIHFRNFIKKFVLLRSQYENKFKMIWPSKDEANLKYILNIENQYCIDEGLLLKDAPEEKIIVEKVNYDKKVLNFIGSQTKFGFFSYSRFLNEVKVGDILSVRFKSGRKGEVHKIFSAVIGNDYEFKRKYWKEIEGQLKMPPGKLFGFIDDVFVHPDIVKKLKLQDGMFIKGQAIKSYNHSKNQWGWKFILSHIW